eukprot:GDKJ01032057.1.p1 GENE.GDKJ01032057.1~~GDKJ01032057.1.p1  ORF type:complete len:241 (+),score=25.71 GDKJ01032057.1:155-877(+)
MSISSKFSVLLLSLLYGAIAAVLIVLQVRYAYTFSLELILPAIVLGFFMFLGFFTLPNPGGCLRYMFSLVSFAVALVFIVGGSILLSRKTSIQQEITQVLNEQCTSYKLDESYASALQKFQGCPPKRDSLLECMKEKEVKSSNQEYKTVTLLTDLQKTLKCAAPCNVDGKPLLRDDGKDLLERPPCLTVINNKLPKWTTITGTSSIVVGIVVMLLSISACSESRKKEIEQEVNVYGEHHL